MQETRYSVGYKGNEAWVEVYICDSCYFWGEEDECQCGYSWNDARKEVSGHYAALALEWLNKEPEEYFK